MMQQQRRALLRAGTTVDEMVRVLADDILKGLLPPGEKLDEPKLAERFGVSRTPVREALGQLSAMGLAERRPNRGCVVATITDHRLTEMFEAMAELEAACARLAAQRMSAGERRALSDLHQQSADLVHKGALDEYAAFNMQFHSLLYEGCHSGYLADLVSTTRSRVAPFRRAQFNVLGRLRKSWDEHDAIVTAILRGEAETADRAARAHVIVVSAASASFVSDHRSSTPEEMSDA
ncbi:GntR family transcriptional regulator [Oceanibaculum pacificum]|uniref:GntR family transcriptional regulator n=1 Tax=Oceanibaculum pacificum TaxID=580166 RepID=A0A154W4S7_9PROT|nr:GntR family transcriptional regulator [Oceanibaculum pacificum]KZD08555.1 GntR family transcriptional regulator [Oceanibaculum pacificum]